MKIRSFGVFFLLSASMLLAQGADKLALAEETIQAMHADKTLEAVSAQLQKMASQMVPETASPESREHAKAVSQKVMALTMEGAKSMVAKMATIYAEVFTESELKDLKAFYLSPAGRSFVEKQPQVMQKMLPLIQEMQSDLVVKMKQIVEEENSRAAAPSKAGN